MLSVDRAAYPACAGSCAFPGKTLVRAAPARAGVGGHDSLMGMRYVIIGAGAVGATIGGRLYEAGHEVVLVARGAHGAALRERGLRLTLPERDLALPVPVVERPEALDLRADDVLVLAVKSQDTVAALEAWAGRPVDGGGTAGARLPLLCAQNGVSNEAQALRRFRHVYGVCVWLPAEYLEPGCVVAPAGPLTGMLHLGRYPSPGEPAGALLRAVAADLESAGFGAPLPVDVMPWKYAKLLSNLGNALGAVSGPVRDEEGRALRTRVHAEGEAALAAAGIGYPDEEAVARVRGDLVTLREIAGRPRGGSSTWQSLARGTGSVEVDHLNGEIVLLGRLHGVPTPVNEVLQAVAGDAARRGLPPGGVPAGQLASLVRAAAGPRESAAS